MVESCTQKPAVGRLKKLFELSTSSHELVRYGTGVAPCVFDAYSGAGIRSTRVGIFVLATHDNTKLIDTSYSLRSS